MIIVGTVVRECKCCLIKFALRSKIVCDSGAYQENQSRDRAGKLTFKGDRNMSCNRQKLNGQEKSDNKTRLVETYDYITTAYGSLKYYKCEKCGYDEILDYINFCPSCGREITD